MIIQISRTLGYEFLSCRFTYKDDENEHITVSNNEDLQEAFSQVEGDVLKLKLIIYEKEKNSLSGSKLYRADSDDEHGNKSLHFDHEQIETDNSDDSDEEWKAKLKKKSKIIANPRPSIPKLQESIISSENKNSIQNWCISEEQALSKLNDDFVELPKSKVEAESNHLPSIENSLPVVEEQIKYDGFVYQSEAQEIDKLFDIEYIKRKVREIALKEVLLRFD